MLNNNIRRLIVLDEGKLAGVITQTDLAAHLRSKLLIDETVKSIGNND
jgi:CBS domain-containing protein